MSKTERKHDVAFQMINTIWNEQSIEMQKRNESIFGA